MAQSNTAPKKADPMAYLGEAESGAGDMISVQNNVKIWRDGELCHITFNLNPEKVKFQESSSGKSLNISATGAKKSGIGTMVVNLNAYIPKK